MNKHKHQWLGIKRNPSTHVSVYKCECGCYLEYQDLLQMGKITSSTGQDVGRIFKENLMGGYQFGNRASFTRKQSEFDSHTAHQI